MAPPRTSEHRNILEGKVRIGSYEIRKCVNYDHGPMHVLIENMGSIWEASSCEKEDEANVKCGGDPAGN